MRGTSPCGSCCARTRAETASPSGAAALRDRAWRDDAFVRVEITMPRAVLCRELGPPERHRIEDLPSEPLAAGEVRVRLHTCGINFPDTLTILGKYQFKPP